MAAISSVSATSSTTVASSAISLQEDRKLAQRLLTDLLIFIIVLLPIPICEFGIEPFRRGFFCNDESISYPYRGNTVTPVMLGLLAGLLPTLTIIIVELLRFHRRGQLSEAVFIFGFKTKTWLLECAQQLAYFALGLVLTFDATEVAKYTIGRLRPHFMVVCQPRLLDGSTCAEQKNQHRYIEHYVCDAKGFTALEVIEARRSFPSGHSSLAFYAMLYMAIYLQYRLRSTTKRGGGGSKLMRHFLQFIAIMLAWFTALSRVTDNWHHWSDVLVGTLIGCIGAWLTTRIVAKFHLHHRHHNHHQRYHCGNFCSDLIMRAAAVAAQGGESGGGAVQVTSLKLGLPRQDTSATLDEVISTPPPYILDTTTMTASNTTNNYHNNEQYCTKV